MNKADKIFYLLGPVFYSLIFAATSPTIHVWFMSVIDPKIVAIANLLQTLLAAVVFFSFTKEELQDKYRHWFIPIVVVDCTLFAGISITGLSYPEVRFIGFSFINAVSTSIWFMIMRNALNRVITDGDQRTAFDGLESTACLIAGFCGGLIAYFTTTRDIEVVQLCVFAQCIANAVMGIADIYAFNRLKKRQQKI